jgi:hypothetical protein
MYFEPEASYGGDDSLYDLCPPLILFVTTLADVTVVDAGIVYSLELLWGVAFAWRLAP